MEAGALAANVARVNQRSDEENADTDLLEARNTNLALLALKRHHTGGGGRPQPRMRLILGDRASALIGDRVNPPTLGSAPCLCLCLCALVLYVFVYINRLCICM